MPRKKSKGPQGRRKTIKPKQKKGPQEFSIPYTTGTHHKQPVQRGQKIPGKAFSRIANYLNSQPVTSFKEYSRTRKAVKYAIEKGLPKEMIEKAQNELKKYEKRIKEKSRLTPSNTEARAQLRVWTQDSAKKRVPAIRTKPASRRKSAPQRQEPHRVFGVRIKELEEKLQKKAREILERAEKRFEREEKKAFSGAGLGKGRPKMSHWEAVNRAYGEYLQGTLFEPLWEIHFANAKGRVRQAQRNNRNVRGAESYHNWKTFHVGMDKAIRAFGEKNIEALARMIANSRKKGFEFRTFKPTGEYIELGFERPARPTESRNIFKKIPEFIAIELMQNGKIIKIGDASKYAEEHIRYDPEYVEAVKKTDKSPEKIKEYQKIMDQLNALAQG